MAEDEVLSVIAQIGLAAGKIWKVLAEGGPTSLAKLIKAVDEPRDTVMQALGWLAREDKVAIEDRGRSRIVTLR